MKDDEGSTTATATTGDPFLDSLVERCLAPYVKLAPPALLKAMREMLIEAYTEDELGKELLERARPREAPLETGNKPIQGPSLTGERPNGAPAPPTAIAKLGGRRG